MRACSRPIQILFFIFIASFLLILLWYPRSQPVSTKRKLYSAESKLDPIEDLLLPYSSLDIVDYSRCSPLKPLRIFVHDFDHPLARALSSHPTATRNEDEACLIIAFVRAGDKNSPYPPFWNATDEPGRNHVLVNINDHIRLAPEGREMIVQAHYEDGDFRPLLDFAVFTSISDFDSETWQTRPSVMPLKREVDFTVIVDAHSPDFSSTIPRVICDGDCVSSLLTTTFCLLPPPSSFQSRLLSSLRAGCIPIVLSAAQPLPFQDSLDWRLASFRFSLSMTNFVPEMLEDLAKEDVLEMRRRGRIFLSRIDDAQSFSKSLVAALSERIQVGLPLHHEVESHLIEPSASNSFLKLLKTYERIASKPGMQKMTASRSYSSARWNSGRDLTYTPRTMHDVPQMPGDAAFYQGTQENLAASNGRNPLGLTRDEEQFTVMILTYNRDDGVMKIIERLRNCPHLNKIIIVWNNQERRPNGTATWPAINVPIEFVLSERNSLNSRFLPYDRIETEAVVSIDDDMDLGQPELILAFRMWRENRDRVVGYPERYHRFENGHGMYGLSGTCEFSMILTSFAMFHKEFLFEYSYNQHPAILEHIEKNRNCEDIAINYLVSHLTRKPPLKVIKKTGLSNGAATGLSSRGDHYTERDECVRMFNALYGYNPLLFSQEVAHPVGGCVKGL